LEVSGVAGNVRLAVALLASAAVLIIAGCIFPADKVTVDIRGSDELNPNVTSPKGLTVQINNEMNEDVKGMRVSIKVPENIYFVGNVMGKPLNKTVETEPGRIIWVYSFTADLSARDTAEYVFSYTPVVYEHQFGGKNEYSFPITVDVYDAQGNLLGSQATTWRVTRPL